MVWDIDTIKRMNDDACPAALIEVDPPPSNNGSQWISVDEQLPPKFERVLVFDPTITKFKSKATETGIRSHNFILIGYYQGDDGWISDWYVPDGNKPTHWMPLPAYPDHPPVLEDDRGHPIKVIE